MVKELLKKRNAAILGGILILSGLCILASYAKYGSAPGSGDAKVIFEIKRGTGSHSVTRNLYEKKLIESRSFFRWYLRLSGKSAKLKAGVYDLHNGMSAYTIAERLSSGRVRMMSLTIPEGWNRKQIGDYLTRRKLVRSRKAFLKITTDSRVIKKYSIPAKNTEGYLFPDTYSVPYNFTARRLQVVMIERFFSQLRKAGVSDTLSRAKLHRRLILASVVEREAVRPKERPMMAQVFLNRMQRGMKLESCATIQFLLKKPRARLYFRDLKIASPYNTYINAGLPPGPISNPGLAAIRASFHPKSGPYLYFVLKPDRSHHFSRTYAEHLKAKKRYLGR